MLTDLSQNATFLLVSDKIRETAQKAKETANDKVLNKTIYQSDVSYVNAMMGLQNNKITLRLPNVQSRKEQVQPFIAEMIEATVS